MKFLSWPLAAVLLWHSITVAVSAASSRPLMDPKGNLLSVPSTELSAITTVITSPGTPTSLIANHDDNDGVLVLSDNNILVCRGSTLDDKTTSPLAACSLASHALVVDGITAGDVSRLRHTRHARTLTALFRARLAVPSEQKQTLILVVDTTSEEDDATEETVQTDVELLFAAAAVEQGSKQTLNDCYHLRIAPSSSSVMFLAKEAAKASAASIPPQPLASVLQNCLRQVKEAGVEKSSGLEPPHVANAFCSVSNASVKHSRSVRAKMAGWKSRMARGLFMDGFGKEATSLRKRVLSSFDADTITAAGLPSVASYRAETRLQLQRLIDNSIQQVYLGQVANLEKATLKRFNAALLKTVNSKESVESIMDVNAATLRKEALLFETVLGDLEVPSLGLTKEKSVRELTSKLNDALDAFPDSPAAKLKRAKQVQQVVSKEKKPGQSSLGFGVDLVAMLRPDGFGSLQGYAGYQLPGGNSVTFGVHNDADDPQVIAQFGGVRPPLLRVQPKLRVDVEM